MTSTAPAVGLPLLAGEPHAAALVMNGATTTYAELGELVHHIRAELGPVRRLVMIAGRNTIDAIATYLAALAGGHPVVLVPDGDDEAARRQRAALLETFDPDVTAWSDARGWSLEERRPGSRHEFHPDLAMLASTSGSTGSPKLVRLSLDNILSNAAAITEYLELTAEDRAATTLPLQYCYGLSVINSHLLAGGSLMLTELSVSDTGFWQEARESAVTSLAGVPYTFELLERSGFSGSEVPTLRYLTQAGGRMDPAMVRRFARLGAENGFALFVMYGQTEATARMAYLPPQLAATHAGAIGRAIPGGSFRIDGPGDGEPGELIYRGPNVMMGYAQSPADFALGPGMTELRTGDVARLRPDGLYEIVGRLSRFVKVFGLRVDLDRVETLLAAEGIEVRAVSAEERLLLFATSDRAAARARERAAALLGIPLRAIGAHAVAEFPRTTNGKRDDASLVRFAELQSRASSTLPPTASTSPSTSAAPETIRDLYRALLGEPDAGLDDSFATLGGDSLSYVEVAIRLEDVVGTLPRDWPTLTPRELAALAGPDEQPPATAAERARRTSTSARPRERMRAAARSCFEWTHLETPVALRAVAIFLIVATHADLVFMQGGAHLLLAVAGYNLARFSLAPASGTTRLKRLGRSALQLAVPAVVWIGAVALITGQYTLSTALLANNLQPHDGRWNEQWQFWFLEALLWSIVGIAALFSLRRIAHLERRSPFAFAAVVFAVTLVLRFTIAGPTADHVERYAAPVVAWLVALGWLIARADTTRRRVLVSVATVVTCFGFFPDPWRESVIVIGVLLLVWARAVPMPRIAVPAVMALATASLFIYLTHWQVYPPFEVSAPWLGTLLSFVVGILAFRIYRMAAGRISAGVTRVRRARRDQPAMEPTVTLRS